MPAPGRVSFAARVNNRFDPMNIPMPNPTKKNFAPVVDKLRGMEYHVNILLKYELRRQSRRA
jgi:hypothetical protein